LRGRGIDCSLVVHLIKTAGEDGAMPEDTYTTTSSNFKKKIGQLGDICHPIKIKGLFEI